jgi:hypothetical protein
MFVCFGTNITCFPHLVSDLPLHPSPRFVSLVFLSTPPSPSPMVRLRTYGQVVASPSGRSFYSNPRKRARRPRAPVTPALKETLGKQRAARREEYTLALKDARKQVQQQATQLRETFGGHSAEYYAQEILQRGRLERGRRRPTRWNAYLSQALKARNSGTHKLPLCTLPR